MLKIMKWLNNTILEFEKCFSRQATFKWFVILLIGMMTRNDFLGVTSIIRELNLNPSSYETMLHFFRSEAYTIESLVDRWIKIVQRIGKLFYEEDMPILIIDGVKQVKEGRKMPGVKKMHQESENSSKAEYIFGHLIGVISIIIGTTNKMFCLPLQATIQDGVSIIRKWADEKAKDESHVVQLVRQACLIAAKLKSESILLMDRYFLTKPVLKEIAACEEQFTKKLTHVVTKAKKTATAYYKPEKNPGRGRPRKKGEKVKLYTLFTERADEFITAKVKLYGITQEIQYFYIDLLWGLGLYQELRFVLIKDKSTWSILACSNTLFSPEKIIRLYGYRFKIEVSFKALKQTLHGFYYHFWTAYMPRLNKFANKDVYINNLQSINDDNAKLHIVKALKASELFIMINCFALGLLQLISVIFFTEKNSQLLRWLRTPSKISPSETTVSEFLRKNINSMFPFSAGLTILRFIIEKQMPLYVNSEEYLA